MPYPQLYPPPPQVEDITTFDIDQGNIPHVSSTFPCKLKALPPLSQACRIDYIIALSAREIRRQSASHLQAARKRLISRLYSNLSSPMLPPQQKVQEKWQLSSISKNSPVPRDNVPASKDSKGKTGKASILAASALSLDHERQASMKTSTQTMFLWNKNNHRNGKALRQIIAITNSEANRTALTPVAAVPRQLQDVVEVSALEEKSKWMSWGKAKSRAKKIKKIWARERGRAEQVGEGSWRWLWSLRRTMLDLLNW